MQDGVRTGPEHTRVCETGSAGEFIGKAEEEGFALLVTTPQLGSAAV